MLSRNPAELLKDSLTPSEAIQAVRLAAIAELDAINLYIQLADRVKDDNIRKVLLDVANEERTHFGEFLELLRRLDKDQAAELEKGASEVSSLVGPSSGGDPAAQGGPSGHGAGPISPDELSALTSRIQSLVSSIRSFRGRLPSVVVGPGALAAPSEVVAEGDVLRPLGGVSALAALSEQFIISRDELEFYRRLGQAPVTTAALRAAERLAVTEEVMIAKALSDSAKVRLSGDWSAPGSLARLVSQALEQLAQASPQLPVAFLSPATRAYLASIVDPTGLSELSRLSGLVKEVAVTPGLQGRAVLLVAPSSSVVDLIVGEEPSIDYLYADADGYRFSLRETIGVRIKDPRGLALLTTA